MEYVWWTTTLMPGEGWIVRRWEKVGTRFATCAVEYDRLVYAEALQVLEDDLTWCILNSSRLRQIVGPD